MLTPLSTHKSSIKDFLLGLGTLGIEAKDVEEPRNDVKKVGGRWFITYDGMTKTISEWAQYTGINRNTLYYRLMAGWDLENALYTSPRGKSRNLKTTFLDLLSHNNPFVSV